MDNNVEERAGWGMGKSSVEVKRGGKGDGSRIAAKKRGAADVLRSSRGEDVREVDVQRRFKWSSERIKNDEPSLSLSRG